MKIEYEKIEQNLSQTIHKMFVKKLQAGKQVAYPRAIEYLGHNMPKPNPQDTVIEALDEWRTEVVETEREQQAAKEGKAAEEGEVMIGDFLPPTVAAKEAESIEPEPIPPEEPVFISPLYILRKHLLWFIRRRVANIYKLLGTTKEEIIDLRRKKSLSQEEAKRVNELLVKAQDVNRRLLKRLGLETDEAIIAKEQRKNTTRRFNIRDSWIPL